jgi:hypothetical protein
MLEWALALVVNFTVGAHLNCLFCVFWLFLGVVSGRSHPIQDVLIIKGALVVLVGLFYFPQSVKLSS